MMVMAKFRQLGVMIVRKKRLYFVDYELRPIWTYEPFLFVVFRLQFSLSCDPCKKSCSAEAQCRALSHESDHFHSPLNPPTHTRAITPSLGTLIQTFPLPNPFDQDRQETTATHSL